MKAQPEPEKLALDRLGGFSKREVIVVDYSNKKFKTFTIKYFGLHGTFLEVDYKEQNGAITVLELREY